MGACAPWLLVKAFSKFAVKIIIHLAADPNLDVDSERASFGVDDVVLIMVVEELGNLFGGYASCFEFGVGEKVGVVLHCALSFEV